jgi:hypothetical protein
VRFISYHIYKATRYWNVMWMNVQLRIIRNQHDSRYSLLLQYPDSIDYVQSDNLTLDGKFLDIKRQ